MIAIATKFMPASVQAAKMLSPERCVLVIQNYEEATADQ